MKSTEGAYLDRVDHLRGWAALLVLFYHSVGSLSGGKSHTYPSNPLYVWVTDGHTGVSMFLVLSGFILTIINKDVLEGATLSYKGFVFNRFCRIYPLLIFVTAIAISTRIPAFKSTDLLPFLTLQLYAADTIGISSEWAVAVEFQCYLVFPILLYSLRANGVQHLLLFVALMVAVRLMLNTTYVTHNGSYYHVLLGRIDQFVIGMAAAMFYLRYRGGITLLHCIVAILIGLVGLTALLTYGNAIGGGTAMYGKGIVYPALFHPAEGALWALVLLGYVMLPIRRVWGGSVWSRIGEISFSLYLLHTLVIGSVKSTVYRYVLMTFDAASYGQFVAPVVASILIVLPISLVIAVMSYAVIEKPAFAFRRPYIDRSTIK